MSKVLEEYANEDRSRVATVHLESGEHLMVDFFEDSKYIGTIDYSDKSMFYVHSAAANFIKGSFNNVADYIIK